MSKATSAKKHNLCTVSKSPIWLWYLSYLTEDSGVCKVETTPVTRLRLSDLWKYLFIYLLVYMCVHVGVCVYVFVRVCEVFREHLAGDSLPMGPQSWWQVTLAAEPFCSLVLLKNYFSWFLPFNIAPYFTSHVKTEIPAFFDSEQFPFVLKAHQRLRRCTNIYKLRSEMSHQVTGKQAV